jgi:arginyl-tRNA synthetase
MKTRIQALILGAARKAFAAGQLTSDQFPPVELEEPKSQDHGDFATNFAMLSQKRKKRHLVKLPKSCWTTCPMPVN